MALSGTIKGSTSNAYIDSKITWSATQSTDGNYSDVTATLTYSRNNTGYTTSGTWSGSISIGSNKKTGSAQISISYNSNTVAITYSQRVYHNSGGTLSLTISATGSISGTSLTSTTCSSVVTINTIPRASNITEALNITLDNACSIKWTPASNSFRYKLKFSIGSWSYTTNAIHPNQTTVYTYNGYKIPLDVANQLPKNTTGTMTVTLYTYSDSACANQVGSATTKTFTVKVPDTIVPTIESFSVSVDNSANSIIEEWGIYVVGYSKANLTATATGVYSSTINSFVVNCGTYSTTQSGSSLSYTGDILASSGKNTITCVAKDSRGRNSSSLSGVIDVYTYSKPQIESFFISRSSSNAANMVVTADWTYSEIGHNDTTATLYYKKANENEWVKYNEPISKNLVTTLEIPFDETSSYNFKLIVTDSLSKSSESEGFVSTIEVLMDFRAGGKGLGIGKICESDALEIALDSKFTKDIYIKEKKLSDYVVEEGVYDIWNFQRWVSGKYECWCIKDFGDVGFTQENGSMFIGNTSEEIYFPEGFVSLENIQISPVTTGYTYFSPTKEITSERIPTLSLMRPTSDTKNVRLSIWAIGRMEIN